MSLKINNDDGSSPTNTEDESVNGVSTVNLSNEGRVRRFGKKAKVKGKDILQPIVNIKDVDKGENDDDLSEDPAFNPGGILEGSPPAFSKESGRGFTDRLKTAGNAVFHPGRGVRSMAMKTTAGKFSKGQRPYLSAEQDLDLLRAHEDLSKVSPSASSAHWDSSEDDDTDVEVARAHVKNLEENRASLMTAWVIGRHVNRVKVVRRSDRRPGRKDFIEQDDTKQHSRFAWEQWLASLMLFYCRGATAHYIDDFEAPPFDVQDLARIVERLGVVSAPWQAFLMNVRKIYMWEDPGRTSKWMALFWTLWYTEHVVGFFYGYIIYATLRNRYHPSSVESIRETMRRNLDRESKAQAWGELIEKHGREDWIEPLLINMGPTVQLQLGDLAEILEVLANFYRWELPNKTAATLFFFAVCLLITLLADMRYCVKIVLFIIGGGFFFTFPLAARYPKYRHVVSALRWVFWDIPSHAELSIIRLQEKTVLRDAGMIGEYRGRSWDSSDTDTESDFATPQSSPGSVPARVREHSLRFRVYCDKQSGRLSLSREGIQFNRKNQKLRIPFWQLVEMRKLDVKSKGERLMTFQSNAEILEFLYKVQASGQDQRLTLVMRRNDRHKVFSHVLAWSSLKWQTLQLERHDTAEESGRQLDKSLKRLMR